MSSVNQEYSRRVKEQKILRRQRKEGIQPVVEPVVKKEETVLVRARDEKGHYVKDDLSTSDVNEAWVEKKVEKPKTVKKASSKKKKVGRPTKKA
jgi:hypothetical protein